MRSSPQKLASISSELADDIATEASTLVRLWDRAEDWVVPRIPPSQVKVLNLLRYNDEMNLNALAAELGAIPSSASRLCDRLEAAGLLRRDIPENNRREVVLSLTREGRRRLHAFDQARHDDLAPVLERMTPRSRASLLESLRDFSAAAELEQRDSAEEA